MAPTPPAPPQELHRGLGLLQATALNVANMVGIGPFITIPLFIEAMHGPQALIGWIIAAAVVLCDGLVWSELGAALPGSGGSYHFLSVIFGKYRWGKLIPFLFIWQFLVSGTLEMASGYIGAMPYLEYAVPRLRELLDVWHIPGGTSTLAAAAALVVTLLLCRNIRSLGWLGVVLCAGTLVTVLIVIVAGLSHFNPSLLEMPPRAWDVDRAWLGGLGAAMAIAVYDYLGYYNICHLGDEVVNPGRTIPRAVMISIGLIAVIYLTMNLSIIGVIPWQDAMQSKTIAADFMELLFGRTAAVVFTGLILWTVVACLFALTLGYSRIPYAAARSGGFFKAFAAVHPVHRYPTVSLVSLGLLTAVFCYFPLDEVIAAAVTVRIVVQFMGQIVALHVLRTTRPDIALPFRMRLYPLPSLIALVGWTFVLATSKPLILALAAGVLVSGVAVFFIWQGWQTLEWWQTAPRRECEEWYREIISGRDQHVIAHMWRALLKLASWGYRLGAGFDPRRKPTRRVPLPVVSVGNLTVGGTGKTPFSAYIARWYRDHGVRVCFVSRGYGGDEGGLNDEALVLEQLCPDVPHLQAADRVASALVAHTELESQLVILDDGFQHRRLARDLDIVLIDALAPWGYDELLPRGLLREPITALRRAGLVVITRVDQATARQVAAIESRIVDVDRSCEIVQVAFRPTRLINASGASVPLDSLAGRPVVAFCGIGNPQAFADSLQRLGMQVAAFETYPDHHLYSRDDIERLQRLVAEHKPAAIVTTQKDLVKIQQERLGETPLWAVEIGTQVVRGAEALEWHLRTVLDRVQNSENHAAAPCG
ncbi:MAG: tetraacyldisaccharide 4'-kinase [Planctomycetaceae bacterium]|nr:tetraacyldisaccharide 4'-kinase [Planctomycetaceae bacterium]